MIVLMIIVGIVAIGIGLVAGMQMYQRRMDKKIADTADWQETEATIHDAAIERFDKYNLYPSFAFSYSVRGDYFSGRFFLRSGGKESEDLIKSLLNRKFPIQYDPNSPSAWYIAEPSVAGYEVVQKLSPDYPPESGPFGSDMDQPIDMHLT